MQKCCSLEATPTVVTLPTTMPSSLRVPNPATSIGQHVAAFEQDYETHKQHMLETVDVLTEQLHLAEKQVQSLQERVDVLEWQIKIWCKDDQAATTQPIQLPLLDQRGTQLLQPMEESSATQE